MQKLMFPVNFIGITTFYSKDHQGIDLGWHDNEHEPILACADGKVTKIWEDTEFGGGLSLHIDYYNGYSSDFKHLSKVLIGLNDEVKQGDNVAIMGNSGWACFGTHLHYNCYKDGLRVNPLNNTYVYPSQEVSDKDKDFVLYIDPEPKVDILDLVRKTIRGDFGNGLERKEKLGQYYEEVQRQVNLNYEHGTITWDSVRLY